MASHRRPSPRLGRLGGLLATPQRRIVTLGALGVVIVGVVVGVVVSSGGKAKPTAHLSAPATSSSSTSTTTAPSTTICPLTDLPAAGGTVPRRPALLVKIGNEPEGARPQSGLNEADIVFDTPAEGFIMRYVAVYQCANASSIGPTRSVRWVDWNQIARQFVEPILAFAGGINPNVDAVFSKKWIDAADLLTNAAGAGTRISSRVEPDNLYTSTAALWAMFKDKTTPPLPVFDYGTAVPPGSSPVSSLGINFSYGTDVVWNWNPTTHLFMHTYSGQQDVDTLTGQPVTTTNIVVEIVRYKIGPYIESTGGTGDVESELLGSGPGYVARDGRIVKVTWHRKDELAKTTFTNGAGQPVTLSPGRTWVEIVPDTQANAPGGIRITK